MSTYYYVDPLGEHPAHATVILDALKSSEDWDLWPESDDRSNWIRKDERDTGGLLQGWHPVKHIPTGAYLWTEYHLGDEAESFDFKRYGGNFDAVGPMYDLIFDAGITHQQLKMGDSMPAVWDEHQMGEYMYEQELEEKMREPGLEEFGVEQGFRDISFADATDESGVIAAVQGQVHRDEATEETTEVWKHLKCAHCGITARFIVEDTPLGSKPFCSEIHMAMYLGLPMKTKGYYGHEEERGAESFGVDPYEIERWACSWCGDEHSKHSEADMCCEGDIECDICKKDFDDMSDIHECHFCIQGLGVGFDAPTTREIRKSPWYNSGVKMWTSNPTRVCGECSRDYPYLEYTHKICNLCASEIAEKTNPEGGLEDIDEMLGKIRKAAESSSAINLEDGDTHKLVIQRGNVPYGIIEVTRSGDEVDIYSRRYHSVDTKHFRAPYQPNQTLGDYFTPDLVYTSTVSDDWMTSALRFGEGSVSAEEYASQGDMGLIARYAYEPSEHFNDPEWNETYGAEHPLGGPMSGLEKRRLYHPYDSYGHHFATIFNKTAPMSVSYPLGEYHEGGEPISWVDAAAFGQKMPKQTRMSRR